MVSTGASTCPACGAPLRRAPAGPPTPPPPPRPAAPTTPPPTFGTRPTSGSTVHAAAAAARPPTAWHLRPPARPPSPAFPPNDEPRPPALRWRRRGAAPLLAGSRPGPAVLALGRSPLRDDGRGDDGRGGEVARRSSDGPAATTTPEARDRGDRDAEARSTGPEETAPPGSGGGEGGGDAPSGGGQGEAGRVTVNGVVELSLPAPAEPSPPCAAIVTGTGCGCSTTWARLRITRCRGPRGRRGHRPARVPVRVLGPIPDRPPEHTFELVRAGPGSVGDGQVEVLTARAVESGLITDGRAPTWPTTKRAEAPFAGHRRVAQVDVSIAIRSDDEPPPTPWPVTSPRLVRA